MEEAGGLVVCRLAGDHTGWAGDSNRGLDCLTKKKNFYNPATGKRSLTSWNHRLIYVKYESKPKSYLQKGFLIPIFAWDIITSLVHVYPHS